MLQSATTALADASRPALTGTHFGPLFYAHWIGVAAAIALVVYLIVRFVRSRMNRRSGDGSL